MKKIIDKYWLTIVLTGLCLTPLIWFVNRFGGTLIDGLDTNFPLNPIRWFERRFFIWNGVINMGNDMNSSVSGIFFHFLQVVPYFITHDLQISEIITLIFWFSAIVISGYIFVSEIVEESKLARLVFVVLYTFNIYLFNTWENVKVSNLALVVGITFFLALIIKYLKKKLSLLQLFAFSVITSVVTAGSGINPAYFIAIILSLLIFIVLKLILTQDKKERVLILKGSGVVFTAMFLANIFWIFPLFNFLFLSKKPGSLGDIGFTDWIRSLSENTSLINVIRLQGAWDWYVKDQAGMPIYIPYAVNYFYSLPFIVFSFVTPILVLISLCFRNKKLSFYYVFFGVMAVLGIFLCAGVHPPTGVLYSFLADKLPFFSFFRSPWYIFTPFITLSFSALVALFLEQMLLKKGVIKKISILATIGFIVGQLLYSYPLVTGKIFRPGRLDGFYINFPSYVFESGEWLDSGDLTKRVVNYPDDQLETFEWGYRGTDSITSLMSDKEFISPSFNSVGNSVGSILSRMYVHLKKGEYEAAYSVFKLLGANTLFIKNDISSLAPKIDESKMKSIASPITFGQWSFYQITDDKTNSKIFTPNYFYLNNTSAENLADAATLMETSSVSVQPGDTEVAKINGLDSLEGEIVNIETESYGSYTFDIKKQSEYTIALERGDLAPNSFSLTLDGLTIKPKVTEGISYIWKENLAPGHHIIKVQYPQGENLFLNFDASKYSNDDGLRKDELPENENKTLVFYNDSKFSKRISIPVTGFNANKKYELSFDYKYFYGTPPVIEGLEYYPGSSVKLYPTYLALSNDWQKEIVEVNPIIIADAKLDLNLRFSQTETDTRSKVFLDNLSFVRKYDNKLTIIRESQKVFDNPVVKYTKINPTKYEIDITNANSSFVLTFLENYDQNWVLSSDTYVGQTPHFLINGYANAWYFQSPPKNFKVLILYKPQSYYMVSAGVSLATLAAAILILVSYKHWRKNVEKN